MLFLGGGFIGLIFLGAWLFALFDAVTAPADQVRNLQKVLWVLIVLFFLEFGAAAWFLFGRPRANAAGAPARSGTGWSGTGWTVPGGSGRSAARRPIAPDDDPEFLRSLNRPDNA